MSKHKAAPRQKGQTTEGRQKVGTILIYFIIRKDCFQVKMKPFRAMVYGEPFRLNVRDEKPQPVKKPGDDINKKLEHVLLLLTQLLEGEQKARDRAKQRRFQEMCSEAQQGYRSRNPHTRQNQNRISLRVENDQKPTAVRDRAMMSSYERACLESQNAYADRHPHSKRG